MIKNFIYNSIEIMPPLLLPALAGLFTSLCGSLNIALEGLILISAFFSCAFYVITGNIFIAIILAVLITTFITLIQSVIVIFFKANNFIVGLSVNMFALGFSGLMSYKMFGHNGVILANNIAIKKIFINTSGNTSILSSIFLGHNVFVYISVILVVVVYFIINKTLFGLRLRSIGLDKRASITAGVDTKKYTIIAFVISGLITSLSGICLVLQVSSYTPNMSASKGWIALVLIFLGRYNPFIIFLSAFIFAFSDTISNYAQGVLNIPTDFILAIPFVVCLLFLVLQYAENKRK